MNEQLKYLLLVSFNSWFDFYIRHYKIITAIFSIGLIGILSLLGWTSAQSIRTVVGEDFNSQQLILARYAASRIENSFTTLKRELSLLGFSPAIQYFESVQMERRIGVVYSSIREEGCVEIRFVEQKKSITYVSDRQGFRAMYPTEKDFEYLAWAETKTNRGKIQMSNVSQAIYGGKQNNIIHMALPVWQVSVDDAHRIATNDFSGVLIFVVDATALAEKVTSGLRSGKTGYAWVIDNKGVFLYHPELAFIGKSAFEVRKEKKSTISFERINEIQKEMILQGKEGMSWYVSGWHRGQEGEMKKLIAYSPVFLSKEGTSVHWSVALAAPISEVEGTIHGLLVRQGFLLVIAVMVTIGGGFLIVGILLRWSATIRREVDEKTRELKKSEFQCRSLIEHAGDIIYTVSPDNLILSMNNYGYQFFRKEPPEIIGHRISDLFPPESAELQAKEIAQIFDRNESGNFTCSTIIQGNEYWLSINFSGLLDEWGNVYKALGIARDITERKKIEQQMAHTEKLASVGTLAAGVAHEINNPLTVILGFTDLLIEQFPPDSEEYELLKTIEKQGFNAKRIVENLLGFARYTEHKEEDVDINADIEAVIAVVMNNLSIKKITLRKNLAENLPIIRGAPGELQQVFFNLINNALAVMKGGGTLTVSTQTKDNGKKVEILIADTGEGIGKEIRGKIFDPFFTTKKVGEGTGLGLSISYGIISKHGGTMTFTTQTKEESENPGTTFMITLPAKQAA